MKAQFLAGGIPVRLDGRWGDERMPRELLEARVMEYLENSNGRGRLKDIAGGVGRSAAAVNDALVSMAAVGSVRRSGAWWVLAGNSAAQVEPSGAIRSGIDYGIVLDDLKRRREQLDVAIAAIEALA